MNSKKSLEDMNQRVVLVTGGTGFIGSHLVPVLIADGWQVHILRRFTLSKSADQTPTNVCTHVYDGNVNNLIQIFKDVKPDLVIHLASLFIANHEAMDAEKLIQSNILFGIHLLEGMRISNVKNLINTGTSWQHFMTDNYSPVNLYSATKQAFEVLLQYYVEAEEFKVITLLLPDTYGPGDNRGKLISLLLEVAKSNQPLDMSKGEQKIDIVHVHDVVRGYEIAADLLMTNRVNTHERYAISFANMITLQDLVRTLENLLGINLPINWGKRPYRPREVMVPWQGELLPGWQPLVNLKDGLHQMLFPPK